MSTFDLINHDIEAYCESHTTPETPLLYRLNRQTHLQTINPRMLSGQLQGQFLTFITRMMRPAKVLEVGTFTGYSAICIAKGLPDGAVLHTIEANEEYEDRIMQYFEESGFGDKITLHIGNAEDVIPLLDETWDLVFIDADKTDYRRLYDLVFPMVKAHGFILVDNTLWNGKVTCEPAHNDKDTKAVRDFNEFIQNDNRVENLLLPFRDGIMIIEKL